MAFRLQLSRALYREMVAHARAELPNECCGLLAGPPTDTQSSVARAVKSYRLVNAAASPTEYLSDPRSMFDAVRDMRERGLDIVAVYHSHPTSAPIPSAKDRERNYSSEVMNFIISLSSDQPEVQAWWLTADCHSPAEWGLLEEAG